MESQIQFMLERLIINGPLTINERHERAQTKEEVVNRMISRWFQTPEMIQNLLQWDADTTEWHQNMSRDELLQQVQDYESIIWNNDECQLDKHQELIDGLITVRQAFRSLTVDEANQWNQWKLQLNPQLPKDAFSKDGFPSKLIFLSDILRKLYHSYAGEVDFGGSIGKCGIRMNLHHTQEWEDKFTELLRRCAPLREIMRTFTMEQLLTYGW